MVAPTIDPGEGLLLDPLEDATVVKVANTGVNTEVDIVREGKADSVAL